MGTMRGWLGLGLMIGLGLTGGGARGDDGAAAKAATDRAVGTSYRIPYRVTETNHFLVRVRVNGKGPFNFLVDTGAPALYVGTDTAKKVGLASNPDSFWTVVDRLDFEGGASLTKINGRVEDPFQMVGMNALGLPGASIDGILGYTALARFRIELDPTADRMTWTRLDFEPKDPFVPRAAVRGQPPAEMRAMNALGPIAKAAALLVGKQPEETQRLRGSLGLALDDGANGPVVAGALGNQASVRVGDRITKVGDRDVHNVAEALAAVGSVRPGDKVAVVVVRDGQSIPLELTAAEGL